MAPVGLTYKSNCTYPPLRLYRKLVRKARLPVVIPLYKQARIHLERYIEHQFGLAPGCEIDPYDLPPRPTFEELFTKQPKPDNRSKPVDDFVMPLTNSDVLLGNEFLWQFGSLNIRYLQDNSPNLEQWTLDSDISSEDNQNDMRVFMLTARQIPAASMALVKVMINYGIQNPTAKAWIVEPSTDLFMKKGVSLGHSIITNLNEVYLTNLSNQVQYIPRGTCLAKLETIYETNSLCVNNMTELPMDETINSDGLIDKLNARIN